MPGPGARNLITDVAGVKIGQAEDAAVRTGVTVILPDERAVCAVDVRGGGPGTILSARCVCSSPPGPARHIG